MNTLNGKKPIFNPNYAAQLTVGYNPELEFTRRIMEYNLVSSAMGPVEFKTDPDVIGLSYFWKAPELSKVHACEFSDILWRN